uniref:Retrotransposon gag domain-containing protein n=1 Tax=Vitis vinifera TaxID=29760 RepID=A5B294_VITVI|nr:hypothetical protein VITISV_007658 [Vitis vinifera]
MQERKSKKDSNIQQFRMAMRNTKRSTSCKTVKNEFRTLQTTSEDVFSKDEWLGFSFLGLKKARFNLKSLKPGPILGKLFGLPGDPLVISYEPLGGGLKLCMPYKIRDSGGRLVKIKTPHETELELCVNIMEATPEDQHNQHAHEENFNAYRSKRDRMHPPCMSAPSSKKNEKFYECWERYMEAINACPHHGFDTWLLVSYFYNGMSSSMKQLLKTMCGGDFMSKNLEEAMDFLSYVAEVSRGWDEPNAREMGRMKSQPNALNAKAGMYTVNEDINMKAKVAAMARRLEELEMKKI